MAYLNVKDRRLEAKIAYVGPLASGRATNLGRLGEPRVQGDELALFWRPSEEISFRDCSVRAELVTARGDCSAERIRALVKTADGIVFVADGDPAARGRNRATLALLREALAEITHAVPVVIQANKTDLADATATLAALDVGAWPHVAANAATGTGVIETAERALELVLDTLRHREPALADGPSAAHPLLGALRQVLRETVASHMEEIERRHEAKLDRVLEELARLRRDTTQLRTSLTAIATTVNAINDTTEGTTLEVVRQGRALADLAEAEEAAARAASTVLATLKPIDVRPVLERLEREIGGVGVSVRGRIDERADATAQAHLELDAKTATIVASFEALIEELKKPKKSWFGS